MSRKEVNSHRVRIHMKLPDADWPLGETDFPHQSANDEDQAAGRSRSIRATVTRLACIL